jgi:hypothetical protein
VKPDSETITPDKQVAELHAVVNELAHMPDVISVSYFSGPVAFTCHQRRNFGLNITYRVLVCRSSLASFLVRFLKNSNNSDRK